MTIGSPRNRQEHSEVAEAGSIHHNYEYYKEDLDIRIPLECSNRPDPEGEERIQDTNGNYYVCVNVVTWRHKKGPIHSWKTLYNKVIQYIYHAHKSKYFSVVIIHQNYFFVQPSIVDALKWEMVQFIKEKKTKSTLNRKQRSWLAKEHYSIALTYYLLW